MPAFRITGIKELDAELKALDGKNVKKILRQSLRKGMKPVLQAAKQNAPVLTGQTKAAVKLRSWKAKKKIMLAVQVGKGDYTGDQYYAAFVEYGTSKMKPRGYMRKAYDDNKDSAAKIAIESIWEGIVKLANQGNK